MKAAWIAVGCAIGLAACDAPGKGSYGSISAPSTALNGVVATIAPSIFFPTFGGPCITVAGSAGRFDLRISAGSTVSLDQVTFRLGDGSAVGGSSVTIPKATLQSQFGNTLILGGGNRILTFPSPFGCALLFPTQLVFVDLLLTDLIGQTRMLTLSTALQ